MPDTQKKLPEQSLFTCDKILIYCQKKSSERAGFQVGLLLSLIDTAVSQRGREGRPLYAVGFSLKKSRTNSC